MESQEEIYARIINQMPSQNPLVEGPNRYERVFAERERQENEALFTTLRAASQFDPAKSGEAQRLAKELDIPSDVAERNMDEVRARIQERLIERQRMMLQSPVLAAQFRNLEFAKIAHDQVENLSATEKTFKEFRDIPRDISSGWEAGRLTSEMGLLGEKAQRGVITPDEQKRLSAIQGRMREIGGVGGIFKETSKILGQMSYTMPESIQYGQTVGLTAGAAALVAGQIGPQIAAPEEIFTVPAATIGGFFAGMTARQAEQSYRIEAGQSYLDMIQDGIDQNIARNVSTGVGLVNATLEVVGMGFVTAPIKRALIKEVTQEVSQALTKPTIAMAVKAFAKNYGAAYTGEVTTELLQEVSAIAGDEIARAYSKPELESKLSTEEGRKEIAQRLSDVFESVAKGMAILAVPGAGLNFRSDYKRAAEAKRQTQFFVDLTKAANESEVRKRNPDAYQSFIAAQAQDSGAENIYIDAREFDGVLKQAGVTEEQLAQILPDVAPLLAQAVQTGDDVIIPTAQYAARVAGTDIGNMLMQHARIDPDAMSAAEAVRFESNKPQILADATKILEEKVSLDENFVKSAKAVETQMYEQIRETGRYSDRNARDLAGFVRDFVVTQSAQMKNEDGSQMTPEQFYGRYMYKVQAANEPRTAQMFGQEAPARETDRDGIPIITMDEMRAVESIPTVDKIAEAITTLGEQEFQRRVEARMRSLGAITPEQQAMVTESVAINAVAASRADAALQRTNERFTAAGFEMGENLNNEERTIEARFYESILNNEDALIEQYLGDHGAVVDADAAKTLSPEYVANPALAAAVHEPSSYMAKAIYRRLLGRRTGQRVVLTAGGGGSGKSETLARLSASVDPDVVYDSTLSSIKSARARISEALEAGSKVVILYTNREVGLAFEGALGRKRVVPAVNIARAHVQAAQTIKALSKEYAGNPNVEIVVMNNNGALDEIAIGTVEDVPEYEYNEVVGGLYERAQQAASAGRISPEKLRAVTRGIDRGERQGVRQEAPGGIPGGPGEGQRGIGPGPGVPEADGREGVIFRQSPAALPAWSIEQAEGVEITGAIKKNAIALSPKAEKARQNYEKLDAIFAQVPNPLASENDWRQFMSLLVADSAVLGVPYNALQYAQSPETVAQYLTRLRPDQLSSRRSGFELGARIRQEYIEGRATPVITGRLLLWAMLSRKAGAYPHEAAYMDMVNGGVDEWIEKAARGEWTEADSEAYAKQLGPSQWTGWAPQFMATKKGGISPSAGVSSNAFDFGRMLLTKLSQKDADGITGLERLHNLIADPNVSTDQVRREFFTLGDGIGIQNKVLSFALLVTGRWDTLVLDRVQFTHLWGNTYRERAGQRNIYDGEGGGLAPAGEGHFGLAVYEALSRGMTESVRRGYELAGLTEAGDGTLGAFHWDSWLIESSQAIGHPTIEALDTEKPRPDLAVRQGKFDTYSYNFEYRADGQYQIPMLDGSGYILMSPAQAAEFQNRIRDPKEGVVPKDFKVSENKERPWVDAEGVNRGRYDEILSEYGGPIDAGNVPPAGPPDAGGPVRESASVPPAIPTAAREPTGAPDLLRQQGAIDRGGFDPSRLLTLLNETADTSTFLHETAHFFLTVYADMAARPDATEAMRQDMQTLLDWFGIQDLATWNAMSLEQQRQYHEQFAYNFEVYMFEGKAPNVRMQGLFDRFASFLRRIYQSIRDDLNALYKAENGRDLPILTGEVRQVMDRMLASEEQIKQAEQVRNMAPMFMDQQTANMDDAAWAAYQQMLQEARDAAVTDLTQASLRQMKWLQNARGRILKDLQAQAKTERDRIRTEVEPEVAQRPVYRAIRWLKTGETTDPATGEQIKAEKGFRLNTAALAEMYPETMLARPDLAGLRGMTSKEGLHPDVIAEIFGFASGDQMVREILASPPQKQAVDALTDQRMMAENSDLVDPKAIELAVEQALHNEARARFVAVELRHLSKAVEPVRVMLQAAKLAAQSMLAGKKIVDIRPRDHSIAEGRAAKTAVDAMKAGKSAEAQQAKQAQLIQNQMAGEAVKIRQEIDKAIAYLRKVTRDSNRKRIGADAADQIDAMLGRFQIAPMSLREGAQRADLRAWIEAQREAGYEPDIAPELVEQAMMVDYRQLTVAQFRDLVSAVEQIEAVGRSQQTMITQAKQIAYEQARDEIVNSILENGRGRKAVARTATEEMGRFAKLAQTLRGFYSEHLKAAAISRIMDGGKDNGPMWRYLVRTANDAGNRETKMRAEATKALVEILRPIEEGGPIGGKGRFFESIGRSLNRESVISIALNWGNDSNRQRVMGGEGWTEAQVIPILQSLTAAEWRAVQQVWDYLESYRPMIAEKERRLYGKEPKWIEPGAFTVQAADGTRLDLRGGYYPVKFDPMASERAEQFALADEAQRQLRGAYTTATTRRSFTKERVEAVEGRPLLYSLGVLYSGINDVIHDLSWHEWLIDANKLMRSSSIDAAIRETYGPEFKRQLKTWIEDVAVGERGASSFGERAAGWIRQSVSAAGLGFNFWSAAQQVTGFASSIPRVGVRWIGHGIGRFVANPNAATRMATEKSEFMAARSRTQFRELNELRNQLRGQSKAAKSMQAGTYFMMMRMQRLVDVPTWIGAYEKAVADGNIDMRDDGTVDDATAVALADQAVIDSQGSGMVKDLAKIERGGQLQKLFTVFYSYMNTQFNLAVTMGMTETSKGKLTAKYAMLLLAPVILSYALKKALVPGADDDEWDWEKISRELAAEQIQYLLGMMVYLRELGFAGKVLSGAEGPVRSYEGPAGLRMLVDTSRFMTQASQMEFDTAFRKSAINLLGDFTGLPSAQINKTITGLEALIEGETESPAAVVFGVQQ